MHGAGRIPNIAKYTLKLMHVHSADSYGVDKAGTTVSPNPKFTYNISKVTIFFLSHETVSA